MVSSFPSSRRFQPSSTACSSSRRYSAPLLYQVTVVVGNQRDEEPPQLLQLRLWLQKSAGKEYLVNSYDSTDLSLEGELRNRDTTSSKQALTGITFITFLALRSFN